MLRTARMSKLSFEVIAESVGNKLDSVLIRDGVRKCSQYKIAGSSLDTTDVQKMTSNR